MSETEKTEATKDAAVKPADAPQKSQGAAKVGTSAKPTTAKSAAAKPAAAKATKGSSAKSTSARSASKTAKPKAAPKSKASGPKSTTTKAGAKVSTGRLAGARGAIDLPLDTVLGAVNRVGGLVSPVAERVGADPKVNALTSQVEGVLRQVEERGSSVRADAGRRVSEIKGNEKLKVLGVRADKVQMDLNRVLETQSARAQALIGQARDQISALRP